MFTAYSISVYTLNNMESDTPVPNIAFSSHEKHEVSLATLSELITQTLPLYVYENTHSIFKTNIHLEIYSKCLRANWIMSSHFHTQKKMFKKLKVGHF